MQGSSISLDPSSQLNAEQNIGGSGVSKNDLTAELLLIMDNPKDELAFLSHDLIEDQAGGPAGFSEGYGSLLDPDEKILIGSPESDNKSLQKRSADLQLDDNDENLSHDAKEILEKLELNHQRKPFKSTSDDQELDLNLDDYYNSSEANKNATKCENFQHERKLDIFSSNSFFPKLEKYKSMAVPIVEESEDLLFHSNSTLIDWTQRLKQLILRDLKSGAFAFNCDYNLKVGIVSDTMLMEKVKFTFSKIREVRRTILRHALMKLLLFKERLPFTSFFSSRNGESRSIIEQSVGKSNPLITKEERKKMVQKIAVNILNNSRH